MEDNNGGLSPENVEKQVVPFINIELVDNGARISVTSNISNLALGLGLCEVAKDFIKMKVQDDKKQKIQPAPHGIADFLRRKN